MPSAIARLLPHPRIHEVDRVAVACSPAEAWELVRETDLYELRFVRALFATRTLPERMGARILGRRLDAPAPSARLDQIVAPGGGFHQLAEIPGQEFVAGAIGKFWKVKIPFVDTSPETFAPFAEPGYGKVAWSLQVHPRNGGGAWVGVDLRVDVTDDDAWRRFVPYWIAIGRFSRLIRRSLLRLVGRRLGAATADAERVLPGDELLPQARAARTDAVTIEAPVDLVWPWLVQMGCRRAGWYSIDRLDNGGVKSAERIVPELQFIDVGDILPSKPSGDPHEGFAVLRVDPERVLVLGSPELLRTQREVPPPPRSMLGAEGAATWAFVLEPIGDVATRLVVRVRGEFAPTARNEVARPAILSVHAVMEHAQLRNLKRRAEALAEARA